MREGLIPAPDDVIDFEDPLWKALPSLGIKGLMGWGVGVGIGEGEGDWTETDLYSKLVSKLNLKRREN